MSFLCDECGCLGAARYEYGDCKDCGLERCFDCSDDGPRCRECEEERADEAFAAPIWIGTEHVGIRGADVVCDHCGARETVLPCDIDDLKKRINPFVDAHLGCVKAGEASK